MSPIVLFKKIITYSFYLLFFLTPLILTTSNFELFEFPKMLFVYTMTIIIAGAWVNLWIVQRKITIRRTPFDYFFIFFLATQLLSTIFSIHPYTSIFGYYSRFHGGLLSTICYIILFYAFVSNSLPTTDYRLQKKQQAKTSNAKYKILNTKYQILFLLLTSAALSSLYAVGEHFGIDAVYWIQDVRNRVFSTLGQPNWLAAFLTALIPITMAFSLKPPKSKYSTAITLLLLNTTVAYSLTRLISGKSLPTTLASLIFLLIIFTAGVFLINHFLTKIHSRWPPGLNFYLLFILFVTTVLFTKSRSGILAMVVSFTFFWLLIFLKNIYIDSCFCRNDKRKSKSHATMQPCNHAIFKHFLALSSLFLILCFIVGTEWTPKLAELARFKLQGSSFKEKITNHKSQITNLPKYAPRISKSTDIRKAVWEGAVRVWQNYPLTGSGIETFAYSYYNFRPRSHNDVSEWDYLYNKAHNEYLNYLATTGIFGTTAIFSIILIFFYLNLHQTLSKITGAITGFILIGAFIYIVKPEIIKSSFGEPIIYPPLLKPLGICLGLALIFTILIIKIQKYKLLNTKYQILNTAMASAMVAILITNFYGFSVVTIGLLFFVLLPSLSLRQGTDPCKGPSLFRKQRLSANQYLSLSLVSLISLVLLWKTYNYWRADTFFNKGKNLARSNYMLKGIEALEKAINLRPKEALYHSELGEIKAIAALSLHAQDASGSAETIATFTQKAIEEAEKTIELNPVHINFYKSVAKIYLTLAQIDSSFYQKGVEALEQAWKLSPTDPKLPYNLGIIAKALEKNEEAKIFFQKTVELRPAYRKAWLDLGETRTKLGKKQEAKTAYQFILENINPDDELAKKLLKKL